MTPPGAPASSESEVRGTWNVREGGAAPSQKAVAITISQYHTLKYLVMQYPMQKIKVTHAMVAKMMIIAIG